MLLTVIKLLEEMSRRCIANVVIRPQTVLVESRATITWPATLEAYHPVQDSANPFPESWSHWRLSRAQAPSRNSVVRQLTLGVKSIESRPVSFFP